jgi:hypothetical protein
MHIDTYSTTYADTYIHSHIHTYISAYIHSYIQHTYIHTYINQCIHTQTRTYMHTYIHTYVHSYICCRRGIGIIGALEVVAPSYHFEWKEEDEDVLRLIASVCLPLFEISEKLNKFNVNTRCVFTYSVQ